MAIDSLTKSDIEEKLNAILTHHPAERQELIPILQETQKVFRYLPEAAIEGISRYLNISKNTAFGVATFYTQFKLKPQGRKIIRVCTGTACHVRGGAKVRSEIEKILGITVGETTADGEYTLETVACIGACALAPTMTIDDETYGKMTPQKAAEVFGDRNKDK